MKCALFFAPVSPSFREHFTHVAALFRFRQVRRRRGVVRDRPERRGCRLSLPFTTPVQVPGTALPRISHHDESIGAAGGVIAGVHVAWLAYRIAQADGGQPGQVTTSVMEPLPRWCVGYGSRPRSRCTGADRFATRPYPSDSRRSNGCNQLQDCGR
jgi:hypothetical protein